MGQSATETLLRANFVWQKFDKFDDAASAPRPTFLVITQDRRQPMLLQDMMVTNPFVVVAR